MKALLLNVDGGVREIVPKNPTDEKSTGGFPLQEMYELIGCDLVEHLDLVPGVHLWVDEEGRLIDSPVRNDVATAYFLKAYPPDKYTFPGGVQDIVGNAIIVDNTKEGWL